MSFRKITAPWVIIPHKKACCCLFIFPTTKSNGICSPLHPGPLPGLRCKSFIKWPSHYTNCSNWVIAPYCCQKFLYDKGTVPFQWFILQEGTLNGPSQWLNTMEKSSQKSPSSLTTVHTPLPLGCWLVQQRKGKVITSFNKACQWWFWTTNSPLPLTQTSNQCF